MANGRDDIRVAIGLPRHVKTKKLIRLTGYEGFYHLLCLWTYAAENHIDGVFPSEDDIELAAEWSGEPGQFLAALKACRWIEEDGRTLHDWAEEQPYVVQRPARVESARRAGRASAESRKSQRTVERPVDGPSNGIATVGQPPSLPVPSRPDPAPPGPSPTPPNPTPAQTEQNGLFGAEAPPPSKPERKVSPREAVARALKKRLGCGLDRARDQITTLLDHGLDLETIDAAIPTVGRGGMAPWVFTAKLTGHDASADSKGMSAAEILQWGKNGSHE